MFTLDDSIANLCRYIKANYHLLYDYLLTSDDWIVYQPNIHNNSLSICKHGFSMYIFDYSMAIRYLSESDIEYFYELVKVFKIPDFHVDYIHSTDNRIRSGELPKITSYQVKSDLGMIIDSNKNGYKYMDFCELSIWGINHDCTLDNLLRRASGKLVNGMIFSDASIEYVSSLFEQIPTLLYIWIKNTEYNRELIPNEYDYYLRIAELECRNELLGDSSLYCVHTKNYSKR